MTFFFQTNPPTPENVSFDQLSFCCKTSYNRYHWKQSNKKKSTYHTMIALFGQNNKYYNQNSKILCLDSYMALQAAPLISTIIITRNGKFLSVSCHYGTMNSVQGSSDRYAQLLTARNFKIVWNLDKILVHVMLINPVIVYKNNITQTEDHQSACEVFQRCSYDPNQYRSSTGCQTFDTDPSILSLKRTIKNPHKALKIILLQFVTVSCRVVTKGHTYLNKPAAESCRFF